MLPFYSYNFILTVVSAIFYYRAGEYENTSGLLWAGLSIGVSLGIWEGLGGGFLALLAGQVGLFVAITFYRMQKKQ
jgi:hypothetical protein